MKRTIALASITALLALLMGSPSAAAAGGHHSKLETAHVRTAVTPNGSWPVYHRDDAHTGFDPTLRPVTGVTPGWTSAVLDQQVYASPLVYNGIVYAPTLNNTVYAINQTDGSPIWSRHLRAPATTGWTCGDVSPQGILGTPAIDPGTNRIYVVTFSTDHIYRLEGINLATGLNDAPTPVTTPALGFDWTIQQERGALAVHGGYVYVPFGGRSGDCGVYHGYVFAVPENGTAVSHYYVTPGIGNGYWAAGGPVVDDATGNVFATSGNGDINNGCNFSSGNNPQYENDAVVRLSPTLAHLDFFMPVDWQANWCSNDQDLGGAAPILLSPNLLFQAGKWGTGFLLNPNNLGGLGGQAFPAAQTDTGDVCHSQHGGSTFAAFAYAAPYVYLECEITGGIVALRVNTSTPSFSICDSTCAGPNWSAGSATYGPPIVAGGAVWAVSDGNGLSAFNAGNGTLIYQSAGFGVNRFSSLAEAGGQVFIASGNQILQFVMSFASPGANQVTGVPAPPARPVGPAPVAAPAPPSRQPVMQVAPPPPPFR